MILVKEHDPITLRFFDSWINPMGVVSVKNDPQNSGGSVVILANGRINIKQSPFEFVTKMNDYLRK